MSLKEKLLEILPESGVSSVIKLVPFSVLVQDTQFLNPVIGLSIDITDIQDINTVINNSFFKAIYDTIGNKRLTFLIDLLTGIAQWDPYKWDQQHLIYASLRLQMDFDQIKPFSILKFPSNVVEEQDD